MWWISVCLCVCSDVNVPVCAGMSLCASVFFFPNKDKSTLIIMPKPWSTTAVMYHASQTSSSLSLPSYFTDSPSSRLRVLPESKTQPDLSRSETVHICQKTIVLISHSGSLCLFMSGLVSYACFNSDNHMNNAWCLLCVCRHVTHVLYHVCMSTRETTATVFVPRSVLFLFIHK